MTEVISQMVSLSKQLSPSHHLVTDWPDWPAISDPEVRRTCVCVYVPVCVSSIRVNSRLHLGLSPPQIYTAGTDSEQNTKHIYTRTQAC